jgi:hypothetical protein
MNIVGEGFEEQIRKQIDIRQQLKGKRDRNPGGNPQWLLWQNGNTGWVRMVSSVDVDPQKRYASTNTTGSFENASPFYYKNNGTLISGQSGNKLSQYNILVGGTKYISSLTDKTPTETPFSGINRTPNTLSDASRTAYGYGGLEFGFQPMPGITSFNIKSENRGSLQTATIGVKAYNKFQFDIVSTLYMSLGYSMLIEWGNTMYYDNSGKFHEDNQFSLSTEFLTGKYKWTEFLPQIKKYRLESNGNYDAALCKVVNFNWKLNKDMSYDITITLRTVGDVIEALKINTLSTNSVVTSKTKLLPTPLSTVPGQTNTSTTAQIDFLNKLNILNSQQPVNAQPALGNVTFANSTDIGTFLQNHKDNIDNYGIPSLLSLSERYLRIGNDTVGFKEFMVSKKGDGDVVDPYYIKLGYFLFLLETRIISNIKSNANLKSISIDYDTDTNIISIDEDLVSANPLSFTFKRTLTFSNGDKVDISPEGNDFAFRKNNNWYAYLMNAYVEVEWINKKLKELEDKNGNTVLIDFLNALCTEFCLATGNYNKLTTTIDNDTNTIRFTDEVSLPDRNAFLEEQGLPTIPANFHMYGYFPVEGSDLLEAGIVRDLSLVTTVSPRLASMISIGAQANGYAIGEDATALSALNRGLTDRIKEEFWYPGQTSSDPTPKTLEDQYPNVYKNFNEFIKKLGVVSGSVSYSNLSYRDWNFNDINTYLDTNRQFIEYRQAKATLAKQKTNPNTASSRTGFLPFNLSLTIDGLSGMKIYNRFTADTEYLPSNYPDTIEFIITGISHEIKDNQWITNIESLAVPINPLNGTYKPITPSKTRGTNFNSPPPVQPTSNTAYSGPTPTLYKAVKDQANYFFGNFGESKLCARYAYNIAYNLKKYMDTNSTQAIPQTIQYSANADQLAWRTAVNKLDFYEQVDLGYMNLTQLKAWTDSSTFNYGDILNYYAPGHSGETNMHAQIYTGDIFSLGKSYDEIKKGLATSSRGNSGWTSSTKTNYGKKIVYDNSYTFKVFYFKVKSQYLK